MCIKLTVPPACNIRVNNLSLACDANERMVTPSYCEPYGQKNRSMWLVREQDPPLIFPDTHRMEKRLN